MAQDKRGSEGEAGAKRGAQTDKQARLAEALRENLKKRKSQRSARGKPAVPGKDGASGG